MKRLALCLILFGCSGGTDAPAKPNKVEFPPFTSYRSDFLDGSEGTEAMPLHISFPRCSLMPPAPWQEWLCILGQIPPTIYPVSNWFSHTPDPHFSWIVTQNNEQIEREGCSTGPPNQSLPLGQYPFVFESSPSAMTLAVEHDRREFCQKLPYMSATYIRGVQGDPTPNLLSWPALKDAILTLEFDLQRSSDQLAWARYLLHFRDSSGQRYILNYDFVMPDELPDYYLPWNWPYTNSFQFPGAKIVIPARSTGRSYPNGRHILEIPLQAMALRYFPEFSRTTPDFLGIEIAVELGPIINKNSITPRSISIR